MTFSQLRTFALVAELGSLRAAASALGVSEPAVSAATIGLSASRRMILRHWPSAITWLSTDLTSESFAPFGAIS